MPAGETPTAEEPRPAPAETPAPPAQPVEQSSFSDELRRLLQDAYFDYDRFTLRPDARDTLANNGEALRALLETHPSGAVVVEGHADERGSAEYNMGLADRRAMAAREFLADLGIPEDRVKPVSYGKERPQCTDGNEICWQRNRRVHFTTGE
jgi:peptidoglycan-associated lipoprotein